METWKEISRRQQQYIAYCRCKNYRRKIKDLRMQWKRSWKRSDSMGLALGSDESIQRFQLFRSKLAQGISKAFEVGRWPGAGLALRGESV